MTAFRESRRPEDAAVVEDIRVRWTCSGGHPEQPEETGVTCSERGCPFSAEEGKLLCRFHRMSFTYGMSMEDRGNPMERDADGLFVGFRFPHRSEHLDSASVMARRLASGTLLKPIVEVLKIASPCDRNDLCSRFEPALHLFTLSRYPEGIYCTLCGNRSFKQDIRTSGRVQYYCRKCTYSTNAFSGTYLSKSKLMPPEWIRAIWTFMEYPPLVAIPMLSSQLSISQEGSRYVGKRLRLGCEAVDLNIGWKKASVLERLSRERVRRKQWRGDATCVICSETILEGALYIRAGNRLSDCAAHANCFNLAVVSHQSSRRKLNAGA